MPHGGREREEPDQLVTVDVRERTQLLQVSIREQPRRHRPPPPLPANGTKVGLRPDLPRSDRSRGFFVYGLSDDGGFDDVEPLSRRRRSSSACAASAADLGVPRGRRSPPPGQAPPGDRRKGRCKSGVPGNRTRSHDALPHAGQVVRRMLLRRNIVIDAETARLVAAAVQAALQAGAPSRPSRRDRRVPAADCEPLF